MTRERFKPNPEAYLAKQEQLLATLETAVEGIHDSESFRNYLDVQARFHTYSAGNVLLIAMQRPDATRVAGFTAWQKLGRTVMRGEKSISIITPHIRKVEKANGDDEKKLIGFGIGHVFDISQTEGKELPEVAVPALEGEQGADLHQDLLAFALAEEVRVFTAPIEQMPQDTMGYYLPGKREIVVGNYSQRQQVKTLAHELGHHVHLTRFGQEADSKPERETVAEAVAYVVLGHHGVDSGERSFPYVATWAQEPGMLRRAMATIQKVSHIIIEGVSGVNPEDSPDAQQEPPQPSASG